MEEPPGSAEGGSLPPSEQPLVGDGEKTVSATAVAAELTLSAGRAASAADEDAAGGGGQADASGVLSAGAASAEDGSPNDATRAALPDMTGASNDSSRGEFEDSQDSAANIAIIFDFPNVSSGSAAYHTTHCIASYTATNAC